jgi:hypothetical protein
MKRLYCDDKSDESSAGRFADPGRHGPQGKCSLEQLQHRAACRAVMLLRMVDDEQVAGGKRGRDPQDGQAAAREIVGDGEPRHHRYAESPHDRALDRVGIVERHRPSRRDAMAVPPRRRLSAGV